MSLYQGLLGAQVELASIQNPVQKLRRIGSITKLFVSELVSSISLAPFAVRALKLYKSLPHVDTYTAEDAQPVYIMNDVSYGEAPRSVMDLYLPTEAVVNMQQQQQQQRRLTGQANKSALNAGAGVPVVVFVHGGVWAAGDKWHYAPMAACLARLGVMACVIQYTLYPEALVPQLVQEVSAAFDWAMEHVEAHGGDRRQVSLIGHSAGAHLCMMALLQRAQQAHLIHQQHQSMQLQQQVDDLPVFPKQFVAVAGVYDISKHYVYERERGVHELSTMKRAMGGFEGFAAMSPSVILGQALQQHQQQRQQRGALDKQQKEEFTVQPQQQQQQEPAACKFYSGFQLSGESIAHRIGFDRGTAHNTSCEAGLQLQSMHGMQPVMQFDVEASRFLPPTVLLSSCTDLTVPWYESAEMYWRLLDCGVPAKHLVYNKVGHGDFVVEWPTGFDFRDEDWGPAAASDGSSSTDVQHHQHDAEQDYWISSSSRNQAGRMQEASSNNTALQQRQHRLICEQLPPYCKDIAAVVMGRQEVNFVQLQQMPWTRGVAAGQGSNAWASARYDDIAAVDAEVVVQPAELN